MSAGHGCARLGSFRRLILGCRADSLMSRGQKRYGCGHVMRRNAMLFYVYLHTIFLTPVIRLIFFDEVPGFHEGRWDIIKKSREGFDKTDPVILS